MPRPEQRDSSWSSFPRLAMMRAAEATKWTKRESGKVWESQRMVVVLVLVLIFL